MGNWREIINRILKLFQLLLFQLLLFQQLLLQLLLFQLLLFEQLLFEQLLFQLLLFQLLLFDDEILVIFNCKFITWKYTIHISNWPIKVIALLSVRIWKWFTISFEFNCILWVILPITRSIMSSENLVNLPITNRSTRIIKWVTRISDNSMFNNRRINPRNSAYKIRILIQPIHNQVITLFSFLLSKLLWIIDIPVRSLWIVDPVACCFVFR